MNIYIYLDIYIYIQNGECRCTVVQLNGMHEYMQTSVTAHSASGEKVVGWRWGGGLPAPQPLLLNLDSHQQSLTTQQAW